MNYKQRTLKAVNEIWGLQKTNDYKDVGFRFCPLCKIYFNNNDNYCDGCVKFWADVIPVLKAISKKYFTPRFCKAFPEKARAKFKFMVEIDQKIYDKYK